MLLALLAVLALQKPASQTITETWPDGSPRVVREVISDGAGGWLDDGVYTTFHENGARAEVGRCAKGLRVGLWESFHPNGKPQAKGRYVKGRMEGKWSFWRDDGVENLADSGSYKPVVESNDQGRLVCEGQTRDGQSHGTWSFYWDDGSLLAQGPYRNGARHGVWIAIGLDGAPVRRALSGEYEAGRRVRELDSERLNLLAAGVGSGGKLELGPAPEWLLDAAGSAARFEELKSFDSHRAQRARELAVALLSLRVDDAAQQAVAAQWCERLRELARGHSPVAITPEALRDPAQLREVVSAWSLVLATCADDWFLWSLDLQKSCAAHSGSVLSSACPLLSSPPLRGEASAPRSAPRGASKWYERRNSDAKTRTRLCGGEKEAAALDAALAWLVQHQNPAGEWSPSGFHSNCAAHGGEECAGEGETLNRVGVTSLALLALLGDGSTLSHGTHRDAVRRAVSWLLEAQDSATGQLAKAKAVTFMYDHALATMALSEALVFDDAEPLRSAVERAVGYLLKSRRTSRTGVTRWSYEVPGMEEHYDTSLASCIVLALAAARDADVEVEPAAFVGALRFLDELTDPITGRTGYDSIGTPSARVSRINDHFPEDANEPLTALALAARLAVGEVAKTQPLIGKGTALMLQKLPRWETTSMAVDFYYWAFGSFAMSALSGAADSAWMRALRAALLTGQEQAPGVRGSWDPQLDPWGFAGGRVYTTAMGALALEGALRMDPARYTAKK